MSRKRKVRLPRPKLATNFEELVSAKAFEKVGIQNDGSCCRGEGVLDD
jgi:hypothetical protein